MPSDVRLGLVNNLQFVLYWHLQILQMLGVPRTYFCQQLSFEIVVVSVDLVYRLLSVLLKDVAVIFQHILGLVVLSLSKKRGTRDFSYWESPAKAV